MNKIQKEIFEMEQELGVPSNLRWHNSKPKQMTTKEGYGVVSQNRKVLEFVTEEESFKHKFCICTTDEEQRCCKNVKDVFGCGLKEQTKEEPFKHICNILSKE